ncbi:MAG: DUF6588 family protein [Candidatus Eisenbacteria bacterium]|nr:hypothetical protein [Candidatus Eisenbacteria bacterium]
MRGSRPVLLPLPLLAALPLALAMLAPGPAHAQIEPNLSTYTGPNAKGYLGPLNEGFGAALQSLLYRTADLPEHDVRVNLSVKTMFVKFGDDDRTFQASTPEGFFPEQIATAPTVVGNERGVEVGGDAGTSYTFPGGFDVGSLGIAVPEITISGIYGSEISARFIAFDTGDTDLGDLSLIGVGARHSISRYFPDLPVSIAAGLFWQKFEMGEDLIDANALTVGVQASRAFGVLEPYVGLSYDSFDMSVDYEDAGDPPTRLSVDFDKQNNARLTGGLSLNLSFVHLQAEGSLSDKTAFGFGLSLGN